MSTQIEINSDVVKYLALNGYRPDSIIDELVERNKNFRRCFNNANCS